VSEIEDMDAVLNTARQLAEKFRAVPMNGAVPEREDFYKLAVMVHGILEWIRAHEARGERRV
jgi:hypothetical protein